jgi:ArsR family transcriptional regulator
MPKSDPTTQLLAFKALANDARFRILQTIVADGREHTCQELIATLGMTPPATSNHLRILQQADLVTTRRRGTQIYVALASSDLAYQMAAVVRRGQT